MAGAEGFEPSARGFGVAWGSSALQIKRPYCPKHWPTRNSSSFTFPNALIDAVILSSNTPAAQNNKDIIYSTPSLLINPLFYLGISF